MYYAFKHMKSVSISIIVVLIMNAATLTLFASDSVKATTVKVIQTSDNSVELLEGSTKEAIAINEISNTITKINVSDGIDSSYFIVDKSRGTIYSSLVDKSFDLQDFVEDNLSVSATRAAKNVTTKKISFAKIKKGLGGTATVATIAGIVLSILSGLGYALPAMLAVLTDKIGQIATVASLVVKGSSKHGLAIKMKSYTRSTTKNGKVYKYKAWKVTNVSRY